jgi:hypothetical protein
MNGVKVHFELRVVRLELASRRHHRLHRLNRLRKDRPNVHDSKIRVLCLSNERVYSN